MKSRIGYCLYLLIILFNSYLSYSKTNNRELIDNAKLQNVINPLLPVIIENFLQEIKIEIEQYFLHMNRFVKNEKPTWIYSYWQNNLRSFLEQNNFLNTMEVQGKLLNNLQYKDSIKLYVLFIDKDFSKTTRIVYYSKKKEKITRLLSERIFQDSKTLLSDNKKNLFFTPYQTINIIRINPKVPVQEIQKTYRRYLGQKKIDYSITNQERLLLKKSLEDQYLFHYDLNLISIIKQTNVLNFALNQLEEQSVFEKFKRKMLNYLYKNHTVPKVKIQTVDKKTNNITRYIFNDDREDVMVKLKKKLVKLRKIYLIIALYDFLY
jgi:hypothetical protein